MYAELQVTTNYSFLRSGSHPGELALQAVELGHTPSASPTATRWPAWCAPMRR